MGKTGEKIFFAVMDIFVLFIVFLAVILTFLEDFSVYYGIQSDLINLLKSAAVLFDLFFLFEFFARLADGITKGKSFYYFFCENGWVDFLSSFPLLVFLSGPQFIRQLAGIDVLSLSVNFMGNSGIMRSADVLLITVINSVRILRFLRILKIFRKINAAPLTVTQRQTAAVSTIVISVMTAFFIVLNILQEYGYFPDPYSKGIENGFALNNMINFSLIISVQLSIILIYFGIFRSTVAKPVKVMRMGFERFDYVKKVKIKKHLANDDVFLLARDYNERWLPAKIRKISGSRESRIKTEI